MEAKAAKRLKTKETTAPPQLHSDEVFDLGSDGEPIRNTFKSRVVSRPKKVRREQRELRSETLCPLCGKLIPPGQLLDHKQVNHGESKIVPSPAQPHKGNQWVSVVSGGLPSLGKNSR